MKILRIEDVRALDEFTIKTEPVASIDLMERAAGAFCDWLEVNVVSKNAAIFCGVGNNGGDGLASARILTQRGYKVETFVIGDIAKASKDFKHNWERLDQKPQLLSNELPTIQSGSIIVDAIFGSGLSRGVTGNFAKIINSINQLNNTVISIDIPSGLFADKVSTGDVIIKADATVTFQLPKLAFMFPQNYQYVGEWYVVDIGLNQEFIHKTETNYYLMEEVEIRSLITPLSKFSHKGTNGHALLVAGSHGKMGAAILSAKAALRTGVGLLSVHLPGSGNDIMQTAVPEAMVISDINENYISSVAEVEKYKAIGLGPGLGKHISTVNGIIVLLQNIQQPLVIDADALNIIAENQEILETIPPNSILTPHPKEFERLVGSWKDDFERLDKLKAFAQKHKIIIVLKGAHTSIALSNGRIYFNTTGNPGMGKGGSGDVLLGMITSFLAQGFAPEEAARLGVYTHGLAGDLAKEMLHERGMIASDIIDMIPEAFRQLTD